MAEAPAEITREDEIRRHVAAKKDIETRFTAEVTADFEGEGLSAAVITALLTVAMAIIALLAAPEPVISKLTAVLLTAGVGLFAVLAFVWVVVSSSNDLVKAWERRNEREEAEDKQHRDNMGGG